MKLRTQIYAMNFGGNFLDWTSEFVISDTHCV